VNCILIASALAFSSLAISIESMARGETASYFLVQANKSDNSSNETWHPIGYNKERIASVWVQLKSYETINENSFRINSKVTGDNGQQIVGRIDVNCKNKDYFFRPNGVLSQRAPWAAIEEGSAVQGIATMYCKNTTAKAEWGYTPNTAYLWNAPKPDGDPSNAAGEWVAAYSGDDAETYYNSAVKKEGNLIVYAFFYRAKKGERSAASPQDTSNYQRVRNSCAENLASAFFQPDRSVDGVWLPPEPGRPGGANMITRKLFCSSKAAR